MEEGDGTGKHASQWEERTDNPGGGSSVRNGEPTEKKRQPRHGGQSNGGRGGGGVDDLGGDGGDGGVGGNGFGGNGFGGNGFGGNGFGVSAGDYVDDDDDPMLAAALALSRGEAPPGIMPGGGSSAPWGIPSPPDGRGMAGLGEGGVSVTALSAAHAREMAGLVRSHPARSHPGRAGRPRSFAGMWRGKLQCLSAEAMDRPQLSDGDK
eukprot:scaffold5196_cov73-Isochrysis_galbana.AAC.1